MGCGCSGKSQKKQSAEASALQTQLEAARKESLAKKRIVYAAPPPKKAIFRTVGDGHSHDDPDMLRVNPSE